MRVTAEIQYAASPAEVFAMLTDKDFQDRKLGRTGAVSWQVEILPDATGGAVVTSERSLPTDQVPDAFRGFVGDRITLKQTESWGAADADGSRRGTMVVEVAGAPVRLDAVLGMTPAGAGTLETVTGDLVAKVPFFGGRIEKLAEPAVRAAIDAEQRIGTEWLTPG